MALSLEAPRNAKYTSTGTSGEQHRCGIPGNNAAVENAKEREEDNVEENLMIEICRTNDCYKGQIVIQDTKSHGWGLYSERNWTIGELVMQSEPINNVHHIKDSHTIQYDVNKHAHVSLPARLVNHICGVANLGIKIVFVNKRDQQEDTFNSDGSHNKKDERTQKVNILALALAATDDADNVLFNFYAMKDIQKGEELLWDYETTEYDMISKFDCNCGSPVCRGTLSGFRRHAKDVIQSYGFDWIAPYLVDMQMDQEATQKLNKLKSSF
jgi:SET domain